MHRINIPHTAGRPELSQAAPGLVRLDGGDVSRPGLGLSAVRHLPIPRLHVALLVPLQQERCKRPPPSFLAPSAETATSQVSSQVQVILAETCFLLLMSFICCQSLFVVA